MKQLNLSTTIKELEETVQWFQQDDIDLETALEKIKTATTKLKACYSRLNEIENEFTEVTAELSSLEKPTTEEL